MGHLGRKIQNGSSRSIMCHLGRKILYWVSHVKTGSQGPKIDFVWTLLIDNKNNIILIIILVEDHQLLKFRKNIQFFIA